VIKKNLKRRKFIKTAAAAGAAFGLSGFPLILPRHLLGKTAPSNKIAVGCIGVGRMGLGDMRGLLEQDDVQITAVCDVDQKRAENASKIVDNYYKSKYASAGYKGCTAYDDFRELTARKDIDAVTISTPDHWHALQGIEAAKAGKDIFIQKPLSFSITEGRALSNAVQKYNRVLLVGSQQRSDAKFQFACELVRNGRIGELKTIEIGFGRDKICTPQPLMPVPENLNYDLWLGPAPERDYTEFRVHPQKDYSRPGWLRIRDYCLGMITGWGSHHMDIAHWGMGIENSGPVAIEAEAVFPKDGLWNVHLDFEIKYTYANGVEVSCADNTRNDQGVRFVGTEGWVYVRRGFIDTFPKSLLQEKFGPNDIRVYQSNHHKKNFIDCIKTRRETAVPAETGHRSGSACILGHIAMQLGRKLEWDAQSEHFINDPEADRLLSRPSRSPWHV